MRTALGPCSVPSHGASRRPSDRQGAVLASVCGGHAQLGVGGPRWGGGGAGGALRAPAQGAGPSRALSCPDAPSQHSSAPPMAESGEPGSPFITVTRLAAFLLLAHLAGLRAHTGGAAATSSARWQPTALPASSPPAARHPGRPGFTLAWGLLGNRNFKGSMKLRLACSLAQLRWG